jgi:hypothetical protein
MPGLVPGIHVFSSRRKKDVDGRDKPGHDEWIALQRQCLSKTNGAAPFRVPRRFLVRLWSSGEAYSAA